jgi:hypothetical protein
MLHQKGNESCGRGVPGSTQVVVVGADHNHLHRIPLEPDDQSRVQLILAALIKTKIAYCQYKHATVIGYLQKSVNQLGVQPQGNISAQSPLRISMP